MVIIKVRVLSGPDFVFKFGYFFEMIRFFGVKLLKCDFSFVLNELFQYRFFRFFNLELVLKLHFNFDLIGWLFRVDYFRFEFFFCNLFFSCVSKRSIYLLIVLFFNLIWRRLLLGRRSFYGTLCADSYKLDFNEVSKVKNLIRVEGVMSLYDLDGMYDGVVSLLGFYGDRYEVFRYFLDCELKFLFCLLFSRVFGMFYYDSFVWDSEKKIFLSESLSNIFKVRSNIDRFDRYSRELDGYLLLVLLGMEGVVWYFDFGDFVDFSHFPFDGFVDHLDLFEGKLKYNVKMLFRTGLVFSNWRDFLLELWFSGILLSGFSWGRNFSLFFVLLNSYSRKCLLNCFECFKYDFRCSFELVLSKLQKDVFVGVGERKTFWSVLYCLKRRV